MGYSAIGTRRGSIGVRVGHVTIGGGAPVVVQSMTNTDTADAAATAGQVAELRTAMINGDGTAASRLGELKTQLSMLDLQSTIGSTISLIQELGGILPVAESWSPDKVREKEIVDQLRTAMGPWRRVILPASLSTLRTSPSIMVPAAADAVG